MDVVDKFCQKHFLALVVLAVISICLLLFYFKPISNLIKIHTRYLYFSIKRTIQIVLKSEKIKALIGASEVKKIVFVPNKLINIVV